MNSDYMRNDEYGWILCFVTNSIPQFICFFITGLFSSTGLFSRPSFRPSRNFLRVSSRCACLKKSSSVSPSIRILSFAFENTKMIGIINLVHMYFMNIRYSFCSLTLLRKNKVRLLEIYTPAQIICFYTFISLSTSSFIFSGLVSARGVGKKRYRSREYSWKFNDCRISGRKTGNRENWQVLLCGW